MPVMLREQTALYMLFNQRIYNFTRAGFSFQVDINHFYDWKLLDIHITVKHTGFCLSRFTDKEQEEEVSKSDAAEKIPSKTPQYL